jgi:hypothetical protein
MATASTTATHRYRHQYTHLPVVDFDPVQMYLEELEVLWFSLATILVPV